MRETEGFMESISLIFSSPEASSRSRKSTRPASTARMYRINFPPSVTFFHPPSSCLRHVRITGISPTVSRISRTMDRADSVSSTKSQKSARISIISGAMFETSEASLRIVSRVLAVRGTHRRGTGPPRIRPLTTIGFSGCGLMSSSLPPALSQANLSDLSKISCFS